MANFKISLTYTFGGTLIAIVFGELVSVFIADNPVFLNFWLPISIYYLVVTFIFSRIIFRLPPLLVVTLFFCFGVIMETFVFKNIGGLTDWLGIFFFGTQYIALFGVPYLITKKLNRLL